MNNSNLIYTYLVRNFSGIIEEVGEGVTLVCYTTFILPFSNLYNDCQ